VAGLGFHSTGRSSTGVSLNLSKWCERNPIVIEEKPGHGGTDTGGSKVKSGRFFQVNQQQWKPKPCVYCNSVQHKSVVCDKIVDVVSRKTELAAKKRCFNCTGLKHRASECRSLATCLKCKAKHHTSICDQVSQQQIMLATANGRVIYPLVVVMVDGVKCRALLDTGVGSCYISAGWLSSFARNPTKPSTRELI
jgi:hypothetical protein